MRAAVVSHINRLMAAAPHTVAIRHTDDDLPAGSAAWQLLLELYVPAAAVYLDKTACNAFYRTSLASHAGCMTLLRPDHLRLRDGL